LHFLNFKWTIRARIIENRKDWRTIWRQAFVQDVSERQLILGEDSGMMNKRPVFRAFWLQLN